jgi:hypothetical protein
MNLKVGETGSNLIGEDHQIWRFGVCLFMTYVPLGPSFSVSTPLYSIYKNQTMKRKCNEIIRIDFHIRHIQGHNLEYLNLPGFVVCLEGYQKTGLIAHGIPLLLY